MKLLPRFGYRLDIVSDKEESVSGLLIKIEDTGGGPD